MAVLGCECAGSLIVSRTMVLRFFLLLSFLPTFLCHLEWWSLSSGSFLLMEKRMVAEVLISYTDTKMCKRRPGCHMLLEWGNCLHTCTAPRVASHVHAPASSRQTRGARVGPRLTQAPLGTCPQGGGTSQKIGSVKKEEGRCGWVLLGNQWCWPH